MAKKKEGRPKPTNQDLICGEDCNVMAIFQLIINKLQSIIELSNCVWNL